MSDESGCLPTLGARPRVIGDLLSGKTGFRRDLLCHVPQRAARSLSGRTSLPASRKRSNIMCLLDRKLIKGNMIARAENRSLQFLPPAGDLLAGPRIDRRDRARRYGRGETHRARRLVGVWPRPQRLQIHVVHHLDPERDTVDAGQTEAAQPLRLDAARIGLEGNLGIWRDPQCKAIASRMAAVFAASSRMACRRRKGSRLRCSLPSTPRGPRVPPGDASTKRTSSTGFARTWLLKSQ